MTLFQRKRIKEITEEMSAKAESKVDSLLMRLVKSEKTWLCVTVMGALVFVAAFV